MQSKVILSELDGQTQVFYGELEMFINQSGGVTKEKEKKNTNKTKMIC